MHPLLSLFSETVNGQETYSPPILLDIKYVESALRSKLFVNENKVPRHICLKLFLGICQECSRKRRKELNKLGQSLLTTKPPVTVKLTFLVQLMYLYL